MYSNAGLFRRFASAEDAMMRAAMPKTNARELDALSTSRQVAVVGSRNGVRLVKVVPALTVSIAERMAS